MGYLIVTAMVLIGIGILKIKAQVELKEDVVELRIYNHIRYPITSVPKWHKGVEVKLLNAVQYINDLDFTSIDILVDRLDVEKTERFYKDASLIVKIG